MVFDMALFVEVAVAVEVGAAEVVEAVVVGVAGVAVGGGGRSGSALMTSVFGVSKRSLMVFCGMIKGTSNQSSHSQLTSTK